MRPLPLGWLLSLLLIAGPVSAQGAIDLEVTSVTVAQSTVNVLQPINVNAIVRNSGSAAVTNTTVSLRWSARTSGSAPQPLTTLESQTISLSPGQTAGLTWAAFLPPGEYYLFVDADPDRTLDEDDRTNNSRSVEVTVKGIELPPEAVAKMREAEARFGLFPPLGPFRLIQTVRADLRITPQPFYAGTSGSTGNFGAQLQNLGPDAIPTALLDHLTLDIEFIGAPTDKTCSVPMKGRLSGALKSGSWNVVNFYTESVGPCPRAKVKQVPCDPEAAKKGLLTFQCLVVPDMRLSIGLPTAGAVPDYHFVDPKPYNNVELVAAGNY